MGKDLNNNELGRGFSQRKDGRYNVRQTINGKKINLYNTSLLQLRKDFKAEKDRILNSYMEHTQDNIKLSTWFDEWFETCKSPQLKTEVSRKVYLRKIKNTFIKLLGDKKVCEISHLNIQTATNELLDIQKYSRRTVREGLGVLRECLDVAVVNKIITANPCVQINVKDNNEAMKERRVLQLWEQELFLDEIQNNYYCEAYKILLTTGMRVGEFSGLQWQDIDFDKGVIKITRNLSVGYFNGKKVEEITTPKTRNSYREIPFFDETASLFKSWKQKQYINRKELGDRWRANPELGDLVFTSTMGSPVTRYVLAHDLKKIVENMNLKETTKARIEGRMPRTIEGIHPHAFRHTFATRCFEKGMDALVVQNIMGHANYSTTVSYTHILNDKRCEIAKSIGSVLAV